MSDAPTPRTFTVTSPPGFLPAGTYTFTPNIPRDDDADAPLPVGGGMNQP